MTLKPLVPGSGRPRRLTMGAYDPELAFEFGRERILNEIGALIASRPDEARRPG